MSDEPNLSDTPGSVVRIGAPRVEPMPPVPGSVAERFLQWVEGRGELVQAVGRRLLDRFALDVSYCSVNFDHPEYGAAGRVVELMVSPATDARYPHEERHRRRARVMTIPHSAMGEYPARWQAGETVHIEMREMGEELGRRFEATAVKWSLNVPLLVAEEWFGLFGVASLDDDPPSTSVREATEAGAALLVTAFVSDAEHGLLRSRRGSSPF